jgi:hypothetical protein
MSIQSKPPVVILGASSAGLKVANKVSRSAHVVLIDMLDRKVCACVGEFKSTLVIFFFFFFFFFFFLKKKIRFCVWVFSLVM